MAGRSEVPISARVPADVGRPDKVMFGLTMRQAAIMGGAGMGLWLLYRATSGLVPPVVAVAVAVPVLGAVAALVLVRRDGMSLDQLLLAALRQRLAPRRLVPTVTGAVRDAPEWVAADAGPLPAPLRLPGRSVHADGPVDLGRDGVSMLASCSPVHFALRTPGEQRALVAGFGRWLHSLTGPVQIVVRADRLDLAPIISRLRACAGGLPHPNLEAACLDHAAFLDQLGAGRDLLRRHILLVLREPARANGAGGAAGAAVVARRMAETARALSAAEITVIPLDGPHATAALAAATDPYGDPTRRRAEVATGVVTGPLDLFTDPGSE